MLNQKFFIKNRYSEMKLILKITNININFIIAILFRFIGHGQLNGQMHENFIL